MNSGLFGILTGTGQRPHRLLGFGVSALPRHSPYQIEHVEFGGGMTEQVSKIRQSLGIL